LSDELTPAFARLVEAAAGLPEINQGTSYGTPSLKVRKKFLCRVKDAQTIAIVCPIEEKELLMEAAPEFYFETDHYKGWPVILVRVHAVPREELRNRLQRAFLTQAPKTLAAKWLANRSVAS
jgi:hypothetical protein